MITMMKVMMVKEDVMGMIVLGMKTVLEERGRGEMRIKMGGDGIVATCGRLMRGIMRKGGLYYEVELREMVREGEADLIGGPVDVVS